MNSTILEYFLRVSELGSITRAASDLNLSQPALSRHISALEHEMGGQLFTRMRGGVELTEAGQLLADRARLLLHQFSIIKEQVGEKSATQLAIGVPQAWQHVFTSPFVTRLVQERPEIALRVYAGISNVLRDHMAAGILDLCIVPQDLSLTRNYRETKLVREPLVAVGTEAVKCLNAGRPISLAQLDGLGLVMTSRTNPVRQQIENSMLRTGLRFRMSVETDTMDLCLEFAHQGIGVTVVPVSSLRVHPLGEDVVWAPIKDHTVVWALYENSARLHSEALKLGRQLAIETVAKSIASKRWHGAERL